MPTFYFIRHAESTGNQQPHLICGRSNHYPLSELGSIQAKKLGQRLTNERIQFDHWFTSPAERTIQTAAHIEAMTGFAPALVSDQVQEQWMGDWEGQLRTDVYTEEVLRQMNTNNWHYKAHRGESQFEVENRLYAFVEPLLTHPPASMIGIVSHGIAIKCLLRKILDSSPSMTHKIQLNNTSLTVLRHDQTGWTVERVNDYAHLLS